MTHELQKNFSAPPSSACEERLDSQSPMLNGGSQTTLWDESRHDYWYSEADLDPSRPRIGPCPVCQSGKPYDEVTDSYRCQQSNDEQHATYQSRSEARIAEARRPRSLHEPECLRRGDEGVTGQRAVLPRLGQRRTYQWERREGPVEQAGSNLLHPSQPG